MFLLAFRGSEAPRRCPSFYRGWRCGAGGFTHLFPPGSLPRLPGHTGSLSTAAPSQKFKLWFGFVVIKPFKKPGAPFPLFFSPFTESLSPRSGHFKFKTFNPRLVFLFKRPRDVTIFSIKVLGVLVSHRKASFWPECWVRLIP